MKRIVVYANNEVHKATSLLELYVSGMDEEVLHQLRISLKKLKSILHYLYTLFPKKTKPVRKKLQLIFQAAGSLRELQLQIKWLQTNGCDALIEAAGLHREVTEEEFLFVSRKNDFKKILVQAGDKLEKIMTNHRLHVITYVSLLKKEANLFAASETKEQWHNRRKQIKQLLYALHWLKKEERLKLLPLQLYKQYDCLQEMIGQWHDATERETKLQGELLYLHTEPTVNLQYNLCILQLKNEQQDCEKKITQLLSNK